MPRSRPASNPLSYHKHTGQYYVTRDGKRIYLGADRDEAIEKYHRMALGMPEQEKPRTISALTAKELANRFIAAQQANWTSPESINHYLTAVRSIYYFAEEVGILEKIPRLRRIKNEPRRMLGSKNKPLYTDKEIQNLLKHADGQIRAMILLGLNCGFGPKDIRDLRWTDIDGQRVTLPRSKTGISQTFLLWPETQDALKNLKQERHDLIDRLTSLRCPPGPDGKSGLPAA